MKDAAPVLSGAPLLSHYKIDRNGDGELVLAMPWPGRPLLGCAAPAAIVATGAWVIARFGNAPGLYGMSLMAILFAIIVLPIVIYQSSHGWVLSRGFIKPATTFGRKLWSESAWLGAQSVVLKRELWPDGRGSTDKVLVITDASSPLNLVSIYNWEGHESRLASGGLGSLARSGPRVPDAPAPLMAIADSNLKSAVSDSVREIADLAVHELGVPITYACGPARQSPDDTS
jgi:hypothetical protein